MTELHYSDNWRGVNEMKYLYKQSIELFDVFIL